MIGYILAFISSIFFSLYVVPRKLSKASPLYFSILMGLGFFLSSIAMYLFKPLLGFHEVLSTSLLWSVLGGIIWAASFVAFVTSIDSIGLSRSNQWKNLQGPVGVFLSLIILGEYAKTNPYYALLAGVAIFISALLFNIVEAGEDKKLNAKGLYLALLSGIGFGVVTVINKYVTTQVGVYSQQVVWSFSIMASLLLYAALKGGLIKKLRGLARRDVALGLSAGLLYLGASFFMLQSYRFIPASIGFSIIQLNAIWTIAIGIFIFKEISFTKYRLRIMSGFVVTILGIALLALARK